MKPTAIIYTSNTGYSAQYARLLSDKTGLPYYNIKSEAKAVPAGSSIIYIGWLMASTVKDYKKAARLFKISAVCGVGLCDTGTLLDEVRNAIALPQEIPLFTVQGGLDRSKLRGIYKFMINMLIKMLSKKTGRTEDETRMLSLLQNGGSYVSADNLKAILEWWKNNFSIRKGCTNSMSFKFSTYMFEPLHILE